MWRRDPRNWWISFPSLATFIINHFANQPKVLHQQQADSAGIDHLNLKEINDYAPVPAARTDSSVAWCKLSTASPIRSSPRRWTTRTCGRSRTLMSNVFSPGILAPGYGIPAVPFLRREMAKGFARAAFDSVRPHVNGILATATRVKNSYRMVE